jgi:hypothetical protein
VLLVYELAGFLQTDHRLIAIPAMQEMLANFGVQAAATRGPGSTASNGSAGLLSIVTSLKPTALS